MRERRNDPPDSAADVASAYLPEPGSDTSAGLWGISNVPWLFGPRLRILFVMDGRVTVTWGDQDFGLGYVLKELRANFAWWVRLEVTTAHRGDVARTELSLGVVTISIGPELVGFRFTQDGFDINDYDQVWFFADEPGLDGNYPNQPDSLFEKAQYRPVDDAELRIIAEWMDRGGGVFAVGDHSVLGASMCHRIPRVRSMRRWRFSQQVPPIYGDDRNETLVHLAGGDLDWEGDRWGQRIFPVMQADDRWFGALGTSPHPVMCGRAGIIDHFPDHMHEGAVFDDDEVRLDDPLGISGYERPEFPAPRPVVAEGAIAGPLVGPEEFGHRPRPHVIAYGLTSHGDTPRRFPMVGVYDGDPVGIGRIVVDSTWHHWFSLNLVGLRNEAPAHYVGMVDYYRNIALWLATPEQRRTMLVAATWGALIGSHPGAFDDAFGIRGLGERVLDVIGRAAPQCILDQLVATAAMLPRRAPQTGADERGWLWAPSDRALNVAILGGIASGLLPLAHQYIRDRANGRELDVDIDAVTRGATEGLRSGRREIARAASEASAIYAEVGRYVDASPGDAASRGGHDE